MDIQRLLTFRTVATLMNFNSLPVVCIFGRPPFQPSLKLDEYCNHECRV
jgi:hypothetical protein